MRMATAKAAKPRRTAFVAIRARDWEVAIASASLRARRMSNARDNERRKDAQVDQLND